MFSGIVQKVCPVISCSASQITLDLSGVSNGLQRGSSVAVKGVCLTVTRLEGTHATFDVIPVTKEATNLSLLQVGDLCNVERALRHGEEVGGHLVSGHVMGVAEVVEIAENVVTLALSNKFSKYVVPKGFVALDGVSLTIQEIPSSSSFTVHLIPTTREDTTLGNLSVGNQLNLEFESLVVAAVK